jgi:hypothetical protein
METATRWRRKPVRGRGHFARGCGHGSAFAKVGAHSDYVLKGGGTGHFGMVFSCSCYQDHIVCELKKVLEEELELFDVHGCIQR